MEKLQEVKVHYALIYADYLKIEVRAIAWHDLKNRKMLQLLNWPNNEECIIPGASEYLLKN